MDFVKRPVAVLTLAFFVSFCAAASFPVLSGRAALALSCAAFFVFLFAALFFHAASKRRGANKNAAKSGAEKENFKENSKEVSEENPTENSAEPANGRRCPTEILCRLRTASSYGALAFCGIFLALVFFTSRFPLEETVKYSGKSAYLEYTVTGVVYESKYSQSYIARVESANGERADFKIIFESPIKLDVGDRAKSVVRLFEPISADGFDEKRYALSKGAALNGAADSVVICEKGGEGFDVTLYKMRERLSSALTRNMSSDAGALVKAVFLGDRSGLATDTKDKFAIAGISHLIAISGMHVSFLCAAVGAVLWKMRLGKKQIAVFNIFLVLFYMALTGFSASVVRAALILCASSIVMLSKISYDGATALGVCGTLMLLANPFFAYDVGAALSFSAYAGCIAAGNLLRQGSKRRRGAELRDGKRKNKFSAALTGFFGKIISSLIFTCVIIIFTLPVTWLYYDSVSVMSPVSNLLFIPLFSVIMYLSMLLTVLIPFPHVFSAVSFAADKFVLFVLRAADFFASSDKAAVPLGYDFAPYIIIAAAACCVGMCTVRKRKAAAVFAAGLVLCVGAYAVGMLVCEAPK